MIKVYKQIKFFIENIIRIILKFIVGLIIIRDKKIIIMGLRTPITAINKISKDYFMHNTKYLFLKYANDTNFKFIYLCDDIDMINKFKKSGFENVYSRKSFKGIFYALKAKYWIYNNGTNCDIGNDILSGGAICINLWHGIPLKKIGVDMKVAHRKYPFIIYNIWDLLRLKDDYYIVNSEYEQLCCESVLLGNKTKIKILGSPRLDVLFKDIKHSDIFMEEDFCAIKHFKELNKKIFIYTPTFRDTGKDISGWLKSDRLKQFLKNNNAVLVCKLHFADKNSLNFELTEEFYKMSSDSDIYPILKFSDALITDYSSIYFDYLLLDKPILYYPIDIEEYQKTCRGFFAPYEEMTAGIKAYKEDELINAMQSVIDVTDNYKEIRKVLRNRMFKYQDGKNCERVVEWIKSLG